MRTRFNAYIILIAVLLSIQQFISGCATTVTKDLHKEELHKEEADPASQKLFQNKCSICHELPDVGAYPYTPEQWSSVIDIMHGTKAARKFITLEDTEKIKVYLRRLSQAR
jgi:uncharacterized protein YceK